MGRRVSSIADRIRSLLAIGGQPELTLGVRLVPAHCTWCEDWMVVCEGQPDLAPAELRAGLCPSCRESVSGADQVAAVGGR